MSKERAAQLVDAGIWLKLSGDREGARKLFERALKLDPENQKAAQLLAGGDEPTAAPMPADLPAAPSIAPLTDAGGNPFEPPAASPPSPTQRDWNLATSKGVPSHPEPSLDADWGRLTGASTPVPQPPPPGTEPPPAPRNTLPFGSNQSGINVVIGSNTPAPAPPPQTSSPSSPRNPTMMQWNSPVPQPAPMRFDSPPPIAPVVPPASSGSSPGIKRQTMSDWGTQVGGSSDSPPPIAPVIPKSSGSSPGVKAPPPRQTISEWGDAPKSSGSGVKPAPARQTMSEWGDVSAPPAGAPKSSGSSPGKARQTMSDWGTQVGGGFDSPPPIKPVLPIEELPAPPQAEAVRSTLHEWSGSSSSSVAMKPIFSGPASTDSSPLMSPEGGLTVSIGGEAPPEVPPPSTPPLFGSSADDPPTPAQMDELPLPAPARLDAPMMTETPRTFTEPMGFAWSWSASQSPPPGALPEPRPSPSLAPRAESAWDQRSNPGIKLEAVVGRDKALDLISSDSKPNRAAPTKKEEVSAILRGAKDLLELDDHTGAMELIQKAESIAPDDPEVIGMRERSEKTLLTMFESKLGKLEAIPRVLLKDDEIIWLNLDHRAGFVLAQIDGTVSFDDLFSVSGMTRIDTARILAQLVEEGVISRG